jgi:hypothetical protein
MGGLAVLPSGLIEVTTWEVWLAITEERMVEIFLHPDQKPEGNTAKPPIWSPLLSLKVIQPNLPCGHLYIGGLAVLPSGF